MQRRFAPLAAVYSLVSALALPVSPLAAEEAVQPVSDPGATGQQQPAKPPATTTPASLTQSPTPAPPPKPAPSPSAPATSEPRSATEPATAPDAKDAAKPIAVAAGPGSVTIRDFSFSPGSITIDAGDTVTWTNSGKESHTATGNGFDTGLLSNGQSGSHTFSQAGSFAYICTPHPFMKGTVIVRAASSGGGQGSSGGGSGSNGSQGSSAGSSGAGSNSSSSGGGATLPRTGADALSLAVLGFGLLALGVLSRRRLDQG